MIIKSFSLSVIAPNNAMIYLFIVVYRDPSLLINYLKANNSINYCMFMIDGDF